MNSKNKKIIISVMTASLALYLGGCKNDSYIVKLESQKEIINQNLLVKSLDNFKDFSMDRWLEDNRILGIKNQPINPDIDTKAIISIYNPETKLFNDLISAEKDEWLFLGDISKSNNKLLYSTLVGGDFQKNLYNLSVINLNTKESETILRETTASSEFKNDKMYLAQDYDLYSYSFEKGLNKIELPKDLIDDLSDFSGFSFDDYLDKYYKGEVVEGERRDIIKSHYTYSRENNGIRMIDNYSSYLILRSNNGRAFQFNLSDKSYKVENIKANKKIATSKEVEVIEREKLDNDKTILWKLNPKGERVKKIYESREPLNVSVSPDKKKVIYNSLDKNSIETSYIYNLETDNVISIYPEVVGDIIWNDNSKDFFIRGRNVLSNDKLQETSSLIRLN